MNTQKVFPVGYSIQHAHDPGCHHCHVTQHDHKACYRNATEPEAVICNKRELEVLWGLVRVLERVLEHVIVPGRQADPGVSAGQTTQR